MKKLAIGCDHAGYKYKEELKKHLTKNGYELKDFGTNSEESVDYPDFVHPLADAVSAGDFPFGILVCGSANGVAMAANKHSKVRAAITWSEEVTKLARQHNNANVLCLPARFISEEQAKAFTDLFLSTEFEGGRHARRVDKISC